MFEIALHANDPPQLAGLGFEGFDLGDERGDLLLLFQKKVFANAKFELEIMIRLVDKIPHLRGARVWRR